MLDVEWLQYRFSVVIRNYRIYLPIYFIVGIFLWNLIIYMEILKLLLCYVFIGGVTRGVIIEAKDKGVNFLIFKCEHYFFMKPETA